MRTVEDGGWGQPCEREAARLGRSFRIPRFGRTHSPERSHYGVPAWESSRTHAEQIPIGISEHYVLAVLGVIPLDAFRAKSHQTFDF